MKQMGLAIIFYYDSDRFTLMRWSDFWSNRSTDPSPRESDGASQYAVTWSLGSAVYFGRRQHLWEIGIAHCSISPAFPNFQFPYRRVIPIARKGMEIRLFSGGV